jgi:hypothetical protein
MINLFETEKYKITNSPLSQVITKDGESVKIDIYKGDEDGWFLEIVDTDSNSTVWDEPFDTDRIALDTALTSIDKEGINAFIDPDNKSVNI